MRGNWYQLSLIFLGIVVTALFGVFLYREIFPEYKIYQKTYVELEQLRSEHTGEKSPSFEMGVKQIILESDDKGPYTIDRCTSCHVALQFSHFSPTKIARDANGNIIYGEEGVPVQEPNEDYIWDELEQKITALKAKGQLREAEKLEALKIAKVGEYDYDVTKVLRMHPLMGKETRPFQYHSVDEYGCTSCHSGNGRSLVTDRAHGPVFDGQYEEQFMGTKPQFTEPDPDNDPQFAKVFNNMPGHRLLFQTTPIYVGGLIQAKCVQCHQSSEGKLQTENYHRGKELYISQACYACHRIDNLARGGVGPELTNIGEYYPWYIKEAMVWPQANLKTSTMPNFHLDHEELEDLMTFLLAQRGRGKSVSETSYRTALSEWEAGRKLPWEKPINPGKLRDLRYSMTVFATEGCAACHRLKGFESNVGYRVEKEKSNFETLYKEREWFKELFSETIMGSEIVEAIDANAFEIDQRIVDDVREDSLLEELEGKYPKLIESYYDNFKYALRAKNHLFAKTANSEGKRKWKERVYRILMIYVQEYGLGRLICPRPNWSGIYRSDEWLIEHFRKPSRHTARSIMPVMPFDDSKFYALTYMLDELAKRNRDEVREIWNQRGFNPELAYQTHCSQCHGEFLHGNGPVAKWIYPIPKNLRNADFLRNFTRENVISSIVHGVKGTPMPPWGETAEDKPFSNDTPVLTESEITQLVDWLFSSLLGGTVIRSSEDVEKWQYDTEDVLEELKKEGNVLESGELPEFLELENIKPDMGVLSLRLGEEYYASLIPKVYGAEKQEQTSGLKVEDVFDVFPNPISGPEENAYYIKKKYYTEENIRKGQQFFELNCAACHGKEADGMGFRAGTMYDAKPRMLTNLHWIDTRDDLRLIRSIKYGVLGTSMTPWGDQTSSLQRLQLVIFIRSLSLEQQQRDDLFNVIYKVFDRADQVLDMARSFEYQTVNELKDKLKQASAQQKKLYEEVEKGSVQPEEAIALYKQELNLSQQVKKHEEEDRLLRELKETVKKESQIYQSLGVILLSKAFLGEVFEKYLQLVEEDNAKYEVVEGKLQMNFDLDKEEEIKKQGQELIAKIGNHIRNMEQEKSLLEEESFSSEREKGLAKLDYEIQSYTKMRNAIISGFEETSRLRKQQRKLYEEYVRKTEEIHGSPRKG